MKIALVTGVAGGIGFATAEKLLENGVAVVGMDVAAEMPRKLEGEFTYFQGDLSKKESKTCNHRLKKIRGRNGSARYFRAPYSRRSA